VGLNKKKEEKKAQAKEKEEKQQNAKKNNEKRKKKEKREKNLIFPLKDKSSYQYMVYRVWDYTYVLLFLCIILSLILISCSKYLFILF